MFDEVLEAFFSLTPLACFMVYPVDSILSFRECGFYLDKSMHSQYCRHKLRSVCAF
jgi:hypothetical protein